MSQGPEKGNAGRGGRLLGSLRDALAAASREEQSRVTTTSPTAPAVAAKPAPIELTADDQPQPLKLQVGGQDGGQGAETNKDPGEHPARDHPGATVIAAPPPLPSAAEAAREARGGTPNIPPVAPQGEGSGRRQTTERAEIEPPPTTRVVRKQIQELEEVEEMVRTERVRGKNKVERGEFKQDPVVGWLVVVGGPGIGEFRPVFEGNNTMGRGNANRIAIDFGDEAISAEEQAYIRYDSTDRSFLFVPNLAKTNVVSVNDQRPAAAVPLQAMDVITMGHTQLVFVPFCGPDFDWSELTGLAG